jgi:hypothetical protein
MEQLKRLAISYIPPTIIIILALNPNPSNSFFSGHGGFGWLLIWLCWPWVVFISIKGAFKIKGQDRRNRLITSAVTIILYSLLTIPFSGKAAENLHRFWGYPISGIDFWSALNFPLSLPLLLIK